MGHVPNFIGQQVIIQTCKSATKNMALLTQPQLSNSIATLLVFILYCISEGGFHIPVDNMHF